jgi:hypothetical protein
MANAVAHLTGDTAPKAAAAVHSEWNDVNGSSSIASANTPSDNLTAYLNDQGQSEITPQLWQTHDFSPVTRSIVHAVRELRLQDVRWFLHQIDLNKNGPKVPIDEGGAAAVLTPAGNVPPTPSESAAVVPSFPPHLCNPSPLLKSMLASALDLPTSSPYIMDTLFDAIVGLQAQRSLAEVRAAKAANRARARRDGVSQRLVDLLTPLPAGPNPSSLSLPSPASEDALEILRALVRAVDVVGVHVVSASACIDYLKLSSVPYPVLNADGMSAASVSANGKSPSAATAAATPGSGLSNGNNNSSSWSVTSEWKRRVRLLESFGAVLDVENTVEGKEDEIDEATPGGTKTAAAAAIAYPTSSEAAPLSPSLLSPALRCPILLARPPALSWFVHPPFTLSDRDSQERYLQYTYLTLLEQRQLFLKLLTEDIAIVRTARAQSNALLLAKASELNARDERIVGDVGRFESDTLKLQEEAAAARTQAALDAIKIEQLDRDTASTLALEARAHRDQVALRGARIIQGDSAALQTQFQQSRDNLTQVLSRAYQGHAEVETVRTKLRQVNEKFDKISLALEAAQKKKIIVENRAKAMESLVNTAEQSIKLTQKSLKQARTAVTASRASTAALQIVELDFRGKNIHLLFATGVLTYGGDVSNLFLKIFRCMTGAPDPKDPNPEVVWDPEPCAVTELFSPSSTRPINQVGLAPVWRPIRIDLWKLCAAEMGRYFKIEIWDCDASVKAVAQVVKGAIEQSKVDAEAANIAQTNATATNPPELNPDGTVVQQPSSTSGGSSSTSLPTSVTLPSTKEIRYAYIGQSVVTLQHIIDANARREHDAAVTQNGIISLPIINSERWSMRAHTGYTDSGQLIIAHMKITDKE